MDADHLRRLFDAGRSFREAFDEACHRDAAHAVEAFELWTAWANPSREVLQQRLEIYRSVKWGVMPRPIGTSENAVCWLLRDEWAGLPPGTWVRDGRSVWLVPGTNLKETAR